jgi:hypothetical protein
VSEANKFHNSHPRETKEQTSLPGNRESSIVIPYGIFAKKKTTWFIIYPRVLGEANKFHNSAPRDTKESISLPRGRKKARYIYITPYKSGAKYQTTWSGCPRLMSEINNSHKFLPNYN